MHRTLESLQRDLARGLRHLNAEETQLRTDDDPARWSIQQIVEHLCLTYALSAKTFEARLLKGVPTSVRPGIGQRIGQFIVLTLGRFPLGRKAPESVAPAAASDPLRGDQLYEQAVELLRTFDALAEDVEQQFGAGRVARHQVLGPMRVSQWREFQAVHGRHHLKQVQAICASHGVLRNGG